jgi:hypothetical protein
MVGSYQGDTIERVDKMINDFLRTNHDIEVINVSVTSVWDGNDSYILYTGTILYCWK